MWQNYWKIAWRNIRKQKTFFFINVFGLALGMACCFVIVQYAWFEASYDNFHKNGDRLYRIQYEVSLANGVNSARVFSPLGPVLPEYFPEIEAAARLYQRDLSVSVPGTENQFELSNVFFADSTTTRVFSFDFVQGDAITALDQPYSVVLTEQLAERLFGSTDVVGRGLKLADSDNFTVSGVIRSWPDNAHLDLEMLVPYANMADVEPEHARDLLRQILEHNWIATHSYTYVLLKPGSLAEEVNAKFPDFLQQFGDERFRDKQKLSLFPVRDIHLYSESSAESQPTANLSMLYLFVAIGMITLLIACINFINLAMAGSLNRAREVGIRKVMGAQRSGLISQFLGESTLLSSIAFFLSLLLARLAMPYLNELTGLELTFAPWHQPFMLLAFAGIFLVTGLLAGAYPAFFVSRFQAITAMKGDQVFEHRSGGFPLRKVLITLQFLVAVAFISGAVIVYMQLDYLRSQPLGFDEDLTLSIPIDSRNNINSVFRPGEADLRKKMNTLDELLLTNPNIKAVTQCSQEPGLGAVARNVWTEKVKQEDNFFPRVLAVDYDYVQTFGMEVIAGRDFDLSYGTDHLSSFVINEKAVEAFQWASPQEAIGQEMTLEGKAGQVVGVLRDFHFASLYTEIDPLILEVRPGAFSYFGVRLNNGDIPTTIDFIEASWAKFFPGKVFEYRFLDESLDEIYQAEERLSRIVGYFSFIAIFLSCFGLFGLAALATKQRFKEIGIRKILGATAGQILQTLAGDFVRLIIVALLLAVPLTWFFINRWMADFAYRIAFPWWVPLLTGAGVLLLAFITVSSQTLRAALANPVESLRQE